MTTLEQYVRHMQAVVEMRVWRQNEPASVLTYYGMTLSGKREHPNSPEGWITFAEQLIAGDAEAVTVGYEAMLNPSVAQLQAVLATAKQERGEVAPADRAYQEAQQQTAQQRGKVDSLIREVVEQIRFYYRRESDESLRRILHAYGMRYAYQPDEPVDEGDPDPITP